MKLYYAKGACSLVPRMIINELGLQAAFESVDLKAKKTATGNNYLLINPKGAVPALEIKSGQVLTENAIILQYLADNANATQLLPGVNDFNRYRVLEWINYVATELHKGIGVLFNPSLPQTARDDVFIPLIKKKLSFVDAHLEHHPYLLGKEFTLPDAYLFVMLLWASHFKIELQTWAHLAQYFNTLKNRPSIQKALADEGI